MNLSIRWKRLKFILKWWGTRSDIDPTRRIGLEAVKLVARWEYPITAEEYRGHEVAEKLKSTLREAIEADLKAKGQ